MAHGKPHTQTPETDYVTRSFVIYRDQDEALKRLARQNHRTFSGELRLIVENHLAVHAAELDEQAA
jgi:hypothetical protein